MADAALMNQYDRIFGFDLPMQARCAQHAVGVIHHMEIQKRRSMFGKSVVIALEGDATQCLSLDGVEDVYLFNAYPELLLATVFLCATSRTVLSLRVATPHFDSLFHSGAVHKDDTDVETTTVSMTGGGSYPAYFVPMTPPRSARILQAFNAGAGTAKEPTLLYRYPDIADFRTGRTGKTWRLHEKINLAVEFEGGYLAYQRHEVEQWIKTEKNRIRKQTSQYDPSGPDPAPPKTTKKRRAGSSPLELLQAKFVKVKASDAKKLESLKELKGKVDLELKQTRAKIAAYERERKSLLMRAKVAEERAKVAEERYSKSQELNASLQKQLSASEKQNVKLRAQLLAKQGR